MVMQYTKLSLAIVRAGGMIGGARARAGARPLGPGRDGALWKTCCVYVFCVCVCGVCVCGVHLHMSFLYVLFCVLLGFALLCFVCVALQLVPKLVGYVFPIRAQ